MAADDATKVLQATSPAFQELHQEMERRIHDVFPGAEAIVAHDMAGWRVPVPRPPDADQWRGTMDREHLQVFPSEKKAGLTVHVWDPKRPTLLADHQDMLRGAGFKVMVGCLQWNRKAPFPLDAFEQLLRAAKRAW